MGLTSVKRGFVEDKSILNVISTIAHHCHSGILTCGQLLKVYQLNSFGFDHRPHWIGQQVHQSIYAVPLVVTNCTYKQERGKNI